MNKNELENQPNPYIDIDLASKEDKKYSPDVGRVKTPIIMPGGGLGKLGGSTDGPLPSISENPDLDQGVSPNSKSPVNVPIIPLEKSRRKTKMLGPRLNTAGDVRTMMHQNATTSMGFKEFKEEESAVIRKDSLSKTDMSKAKDLGKDEIFANLVAQSMSRRSGGTDRKQDSEISLVAASNKEQPIAQPIRNRESTSAINNASTNFPGPVQPIKKPAFLMDDDPPLPVIPKIFNNNNPSQISSVLPENSTNPPIQRPPAVSVIVPPAKPDPTKIILEVPQTAPQPIIASSVTSGNHPGSYENIEITGNMNRHQVAEINNKLKELISDLNRLTAENNRLAIIGKNFDEEKAKATQNIQSQLDKLKEELQQTKDEHRSEILKIKEESQKQINEQIEQHKKALEINENDKKQQAELFQKEKDREIEKISQMHKLELEKIENMNAQKIQKQKDEYEKEIEMLKGQVRKNEEITKISTQVDEIVNDIKTKMENEVRIKNKSFADKEQLLENDRRKIDSELAKIALDTKRIEDIKQSLLQREKQLEANIEEQKKLYEYKKDTLEAQHERVMRELEVRQQKLMEDQKKLDMERTEFEKNRDEWEITYKDQKGRLALDQSALEKEKQDLQTSILEQNNALAAKKVALEETRKSIAQEESELIHRKQMWADQESIMRKEYDDLQAQIESFRIEKMQVEEQKEKMEKLAVQLEEESRAVARFKTTVESTRQALENMRADVDMKESMIVSEKAKLEEIRKELAQRQQSLEGVRYQYLKDHNVAEASRKLIMSFTYGAGRRTMGNTKYAWGNNENYEISPNPLPDPLPVEKNETVSEQPFKAADFIKGMQEAYGKEENFVNYVVNERTSLMKSRRFAEESKISQTPLSLLKRSKMESEHRKGLATDVMKESKLEQEKQGAENKNEEELLNF